MCVTAGTIALTEHILPHGFSIYVLLWFQGSHDAAGTAAPSSSVGSFQSTHWTRCFGTVGFALSSFRHSLLSITAIVSMPSWKDIFACMRQPRCTLTHAHIACAAICTHATAHSPSPAACFALKQAEFGYKGHRNCGLVNVYGRPVAREGVARIRALQGCSYAQLLETAFWLGLGPLIITVLSVLALLKAHSTSPL